MIAKIRENLDTIKVSYQAFYFAIVLAGVMHALFLLLFTWLDIQALVLFNLFSCFIYFLCARLFLSASDTEDYRLVAFLALIEVIAHAYITSYYIGLGSGFHYYILILAAIPMVNVGIALYSNIARLIIVASAYIVLLLWLDNALPIHQLDEALLVTMRSVNAVMLIFGSGIILLKLFHEMLKEKALLSDLATTDRLTGLYNRHGFMALVEQEVNDEIQRIDSLSILVLDIDLFKEVNDQYGHQCGDYVLSKLAKVMRTVLRKHEMVARWGGDEFIVLLPDTDESELAALAERLRIEVAQTVFSYKNNDVSISVSIGGTTYEPGDSFESLASRADKALYMGKNSGRNAFNMIFV